MREDTRNLLLSTVMGGAFLSAILIYRNFDAEILVFPIVLALVFALAIIPRQGKDDVKYDELTVRQDSKGFRNSWLMTSTTWILHFVNRKRADVP